MSPDRSRPVLTRRSLVLITAVLLTAPGCAPSPKYTGGPVARSPAGSTNRPDTSSSGTTTGTTRTTPPQPRTPEGRPPALTRAGTVPSGPQRWGDHYLRGLASWYGRDFHGRKTANGETYDMYKLTAAHRTLPLGTRVRVWNVENGRSCILRVNDRGPFIEGRILDLSYAAALELEMAIKGVATVQIEILELPPAPERIPR
jgi:rare lipoprotein A